MEVRDLFPLELAPLPDFEDKRPTTEPLSSKLHRYAAWARRAELERTLQHLTLRLETLRDQAKMYYEADDPEKLWPVFTDSMLLAGGAEALLVESREEAEKLGGETEEERRLRDRLEHRTEDLEEEHEKLGDMWTEVSHAKADAEQEALLKELHPEAESPDLDNLRPFRKSRAI